MIVVFPKNFLIVIGQQREETLYDFTCEDHHDAEGHQEDLIERHHSGKDDDNNISKFWPHNLMTF